MFINSLSQTHIYMLKIMNNSNNINNNSNNFVIKSFMLTLVLYCIDSKNNGMHIVKQIKLNLH